MNEGEENINDNQEGAPEVEAQEAPHHEPTGHTELEMVFVLILVGLMGIAIFIGYNFIGDNLKDKAKPAEVDMTLNEDMRPQNFQDVPGRDKEKLGLAISEVHGRYYVHPDTGMTLYTNSGVECGASCEEFFNKYEVGGEIYYLYIHDKKPGDAFAVGFDSVFEIVRP